jgi:hypothetical protein
MMSELKDFTFEGVIFLLFIIAISGMMIKLSYDRMAYEEEVEREQYSAIHSLQDVRITYITREEFSMFIEEMRKIAVSFDDRIKHMTVDRAAYVMNGNAYCVISGWNETIKLTCKRFE